MPSFERESQKIVIAGASSLLGAELKSLLEEGKFAGWDLRLVDEVSVAGTLTEAGGEPAVILPVEEGSFDGARFVFFAGSASFAELNREAAVRSGATILDFTGKIGRKDSGPSPYFPNLDAFWEAKAPKAPAAKAGGHFWVISAAAVAACSLTFGLRKLGLKKLSIVFLRSVSEAGRAGVETLESQTGHLLSMQPAGGGVFDAQVAFNVLEEYGPGSQQSLSVVRSSLGEEIRECLQNRAVVMPAIEILQVPAFYGVTFTAVGELDASIADDESVRKACTEAGFVLPIGQAGSPSNLSVVAENEIHMGNPRRDSGTAGTWWFWGAADNVRVPAWNAVKLAEKLTE